MNYDSTAAIMEFTEILNGRPKEAYDFICNNYYRFDKSELVNIIKELLYSISYHVGGRFYGTLHEEILRDVAIELDDQYDDEYQEYQKWIESAKV